MMTATTRARRRMTTRTATATCVPHAVRAEWMLMQGRWVGLVSHQCDFQVFVMRRCLQLAIVRRWVNSWRPPAATHR